MIKIKVQQHLNIKLTVIFILALRITIIKYRKYQNLKNLSYQTKIQISKKIVKQKQKA